MNEYEAAVMEW